MLELTNLKAGRWNEGEARAYLQLVQVTAQRLRSIAREGFPVFVRLEERLNDGYLSKGKNMSDASVENEAVTALVTTARKPRTTTATANTNLFPQLEGLKPLTYS